MKSNIHATYRASPPTGGNMALLDNQGERRPGGNMWARTQGSPPGFWWWPRGVPRYV